LSIAFFKRGAKIGILGKKRAIVEKIFSKRGDRIEKILLTLYFLYDIITLVIFTRGANCAREI